MLFRSLMIIILFFFLMLPLPPCSTLFPYTTLFRSESRAAVGFHRGGVLPAGPHTCSDRCARRRACGGGCHRARPDRKSTRLNSSHRTISYAVFCLKKKKNQNTRTT